MTERLFMNIKVEFDGMCLVLNSFILDLENREFVFDDDGKNNKLLMFLPFREEILKTFYFIWPRPTNAKSGSTPCCQTWCVCGRLGYSQPDIYVRINCSHTKEILISTNPRQPPASPLSTLAAGYPN